MCIYEVCLGILDRSIEKGVTSASYIGVTDPDLAFMLSYLNRFQTRAKHIFQRVALFYCVF